MNPHIEDVTRRGRGRGLSRVSRRTSSTAPGPGSIVEYGQFEKVMEFFQDLGSDDAILADVGGRARPPARPRASPTTASGSSASASADGSRSSPSLRYQLGAAVGFYGGGIVTAPLPAVPGARRAMSPTLQTPWLGLFGDQDGSIPVDDVETLRAALTNAPVDTDIVRYAEAGHGFHCDKRDDYRADDAATRGRERSPGSTRTSDGT